MDLNERIRDMVGPFLQTYGPALFGLVIAIAYAKRIHTSLREDRYSPSIFWLLLCGAFLSILPLIAYDCSAFGRTCILGFDQGSSATKALGILGALVSILSVIVVPVSVLGLLGHLLAWIAWAISGFPRSTTSKRDEK